jgi:hypothetical protein
MTAKKSKSKTSIKEFELPEEFQTKFSGITRIFVIGKVLYLEHYTGALIQSPYYNDDSLKTIKMLRNALVSDSAISPEFDIDGFQQEFGRLLARRTIEEFREEQARQNEEQQQNQRERNQSQNEINQLREQHQNISSEEWASTLQYKLQDLKQAVQDEMPEIWPGIEFVLSVSRILNIEGCSLPFIGIILGRPSSYKTVILELIRGWYNTFYTDNFTARSFVSHSTSVDPEQLEQIDMLPRIRNRIFLTPELSPMFTTKEEDLTQLLGIITRIADGQVIHLILVLMGIGAMRGNGCLVGLVQP